VRGVDEEASCHHEDARHEAAPGAVRPRLAPAMLGMSVRVAAAHRRTRRPAGSGSEPPRAGARGPRPAPGMEPSPETPPSPPIPSARFTEAAW
jgi:hypothetical protein